MKHNTLMRRLIIYFIFAAFVPAVLTASIIFFQTREEIKSTLINDNNLQLNQISEQISQKIQQVDDFSYWLCQNSDINALLKKKFIITHHKKRKQLTTFEHSYLIVRSQKIFSLYLLLVIMALTYVQEWKRLL